MVSVTIHSTDPFATPDEEKSAVRRLRGRLASPVTLWTTPGPAGLTVSSTLIADGDPGRVLGLIDDESDFWDAVETSRRFTVIPLTPADRQVADRFAGLMPAPGGLFAADEWIDTEYGPVPADHGTWAGCRLESSRECGWALLVEAVIETITVDSPAGPLIHYRGRYREL
ncbi:flavin reductase family protein [Actinoplanes sp. NPDC048988]|uniref:flavin reductase family protein n=1 Tax=Actinoplanes sp. NPDC048988 TaxID=3363901 RepID=UPI003720FDE1